MALGQSTAQAPNSRFEFAPSQTLCCLRSQSTAVSWCFSVARSRGVIPPAALAPRYAPEAGRSSKVPVLRGEVRSREAGVGTRIDVGPGVDEHLRKEWFPARDGCLQGLVGNGITGDRVPLCAVTLGGTARPRAFPGVLGDGAPSIRRGGKPGRAQGPAGGASQLALRPPMRPLRRCPEWFASRSGQRCR